MIETTTQTDKCMHRTCNCPTRDGGDYCSDQCMLNEDDPETGCRCGHPECQTKVMTVASVEQLESSE